MNLGNVKALKLAPAVSISDLNFEWKEDVRVCGMVFDFKGHRRYGAGLNASNMANCDVLRRVASKGEKHENEKKNDEHNRTGDDGLRFHAKSIEVLTRNSSEHKPFTSCSKLFLGVAGPLRFDEFLARYLADFAVENERVFVGGVERHVIEMTPIPQLEPLPEATRAF